MDAIRQTIAENLKRVHNRIGEAAARSPNAASRVELVAVTKYAEPAWIEALIDLGQLHLGESRPQQLVERAAAYPKTIQWHLIGHLQRNKVRGVLPHAALCHSVDSLRLLRRIALIAGELQLRPRLLLEINVSGEEQKDGFAPDDLRTAFDEIAACEHVQLAGLMAMAPYSEDSETSRPVFRTLRELRDELQGRAPEHVRLDELSMGMSGDFAVAVEEGATIVRIGRTLYEGLERPATSQIGNAR